MPTEQEVYDDEERRRRRAAAGYPGEEFGGGGGAPNYSGGEGGGGAPNYSDASGGARNYSGAEGGASGYSDPGVNYSPATPPPPPPAEQLVTPSDRGASGPPRVNLRPATQQDPPLPTPLPRVDPYDPKNDAVSTGSTSQRTERGFRKELSADDKRLLDDITRRSEESLSSYGELERERAKNKEKAAKTLVDEAKVEGEFDRLSNEARETYRKRLAELDAELDTYRKSLINPNSFWDETSTSQKIVLGIAAFLGALGTAPGQENQGSRIIREALEEHNSRKERAIREAYAKKADTEENRAKMLAEIDASKIAALKQVRSIREYYERMAENPVIRRTRTPTATAPSTPQPAPPTSPVAPQPPPQQPPAPQPAPTPTGQRGGVSLSPQEREAEASLQRGIPFGGMPPPSPPAARDVTKDDLEALENLEPPPDRALDLLRRYNEAMARHREAPETNPRPPPPPPGVARAWLRLMNPKTKAPTTTASTSQPATTTPKTTAPKKKEDRPSEKSSQMERDEREIDRLILKSIRDLEEANKQPASPEKVRALRVLEERQREDMRNLYELNKSRKRGRPLSEQEKRYLAEVARKIEEGNRQIRELKTGGTP